MVISTLFQSSSTCLCIWLFGFQFAAGLNIISPLVSVCYSSQTMHLLYMRKEKRWFAKTQFRLTKFWIFLTLVLDDINCYCIQVNQTHTFTQYFSFFISLSLYSTLFCLVFRHWYIIVYIHWRALILLRNHRSLTVSMCWVLLPVSCLTNVDFINSACGYRCLREKVTISTKPLWHSWCSSLRNIFLNPV